LETDEEKQIDMSELQDLKSLEYLSTLDYENEILTFRELEDNMESLTLTEDVKKWVIV